jgi:acetyl esterase/lipase
VRSWLGAVATLCLLCASHSLGAPFADVEQLHYGSDDPLQVGELRLPPGNGPFPLAVVIHGGCWRAGATLAGTAGLADALRRAGVATWNIEYRRVGDSGGGWPGTFRDVGAATDFVRTLAVDHRIDLRRVVAVGHSAGAQLALWDAARAKLPPGSALYRESPLALRGVVALAGPGDLRGLTRGADSVCGKGILQGLLGGTLEAVPEHYAQASAAAFLPLGVRQVLITGSEDRVMPTRSIGSYVQAARDSGDTAELIEIPSASHMDMVDPRSRAWQIVRREVLRLVGDSAP